MLQSMGSQRAGHDLATEQQGALGSIEGAEETQGMWTLSLIGSGSPLMSASGW